MNKYIYTSMTPPHKQIFLQRDESPQEQECTLFHLMKFTVQHFNTSSASLFREISKFRIDLSQFFVNFRHKIKFSETNTRNARTPLKVQRVTARLSDEYNLTNLKKPTRASVRNKLLRSSTLPRCRV